MRKDVLGGLVLAVAGLLLILAGDWLDLEVTAVALLGVTAGAVVGLVPDRSVATRIGGFAAGFVVCWIGYFVRAALMPDTEAGRAVTVGLVLLVCVGVAVAALGRVPLWAVLLGAGTFAGAYEAAYDAAPPLVVDTSVSTASALLLAVAIGFLAVSWFGPEHEEGAEAPKRERAATPATPRTRSGDDTVALDTMMSTKR